MKTGKPKAGKRGRTKTQLKTIWDTNMKIAKRRANPLTGRQKLYVIIGGAAAVFAGGVAYLLWRGRDQGCVKQDCPPGSQWDATACQCVVVSGGTVYKCPEGYSGIWPNCYPPGRGPELFPVTIHVIDDSGSGVDMAFVAVQNDQTKLANTTDTKGYAAFNVPAGTYEVLVSGADDRGRYTGEATITTGSITSVLRVELTVTYTGRGR